MDNDILPSTELLEHIAHLDDASSLDLSKDALTALYSMGYTLYQQGKYSDARPFFRLLTMVDSFDCRYWMGLAACHQKLKDYLQAVEYYSVAALQGHQNPYVHFHAAECYFGAGLPEKGLQALDSAIEAAKNSPGHESLLAQLRLIQASWSGKPTGEASKGAIS